MDSNSFQSLHPRLSSPTPTNRRREPISSHVSSALRLFTWKEIILKTDCNVLTELWKTQKKNRAAVLPILNQIDEPRAAFISFEFRYVSREANIAAHQTSSLQPERAPRVPGAAFLSHCITRDCICADEWKLFLRGKKKDTVHTSFAKPSNHKHRTVLFLQLVHTKLEHREVGQKKSRNSSSLWI